ncbi:putative NTP pyrophosphohydrolase [Listeria monocytogenes]|nr:putative NTP pyrophosphohydrolase [Listeria monocytogenes]GAT38949.1 putative NTP pyrophosphohydrolase [Listeria monocytogenes]GAT41212.1 putative NTP pyrophosphohydrolase [Listeria monocytogenes]
MREEKTISMTFKLSFSSGKKRYSSCSSDNSISPPSGISTK